MINAELEGEILKWNIRSLWQNFRRICREEINEKGEMIYKKEFNTVRDGIKLKVDIRWITNEWYAVHPKSEQVKIIGKGVHNLIEFMEEKEGREDIMRTVILETLSDESPVIPRHK